MNLKVWPTANLQNYCNQLGRLFLIKIESILKFFAFLLLGFYRSFLTAFFGGACRFEPSCSEYARQAFHTHRLDVAFKLTLKRLLKCRPGGPFGYDPIPELKQNSCCDQQHKRMDRSE